MSIYEKVTDEFSLTYIKRIDEDGKVWSIPLDPANSDYQAYLATLASSNPSTPQAGE